MLPPEEVGSQCCWNYDNGVMEANGPSCVFMCESVCVFVHTWGMRISFRICPVTLEECLLLCHNFWRAWEVIIKYNHPSSVCFFFSLQLHLPVFVLLFAGFYITIWSWVEPVIHPIKAKCFFLTIKHDLSCLMIKEGFIWPGRLLIVSL